MKNTLPKYQDIPFGQFQGLIDTLTREEKAMHTVATGQDKFLANIQKRKSRLELCEVIEYTFDDEIGMCEIYYRVADLCVSPQSDESRDGYTIEAVKQNGKDVAYTGRQEQIILDYLNDRDFLNVFKSRA